MGKAKYTAMQIASLFIQLANDLPNHRIDNLKLNKLCYYAQGWSLARTGKPLFDDEIEAWQYGPVIPEVYRSYKACGKRSIEESVEEFSEDSLSAEEVEILTDVYMYYGKYTSAALIELTHEKGTPWDQVYIPGKNVHIGNDVIREYFQNSHEIKRVSFDFSPDHIVKGISEDDEA